MDTKRKRITVAVGSALAAAAIVTGTAIGANGGSSPAPASPPAVTAQQAPATTPTVPSTEAPASAADPAGAPNAEGPDASVPESAVESPAAENAPEQSEPNEPALPGGGHADAPGQNVDHQFDGVE